MRAPRAVSAARARRKVHLADGFPGRRDGLRRGAGDELRHRAQAPLGEEEREPALQLVHDAEPVHDRGGADLHRARAQCEEARRGSVVHRLAVAAHDQPAAGGARERHLVRGRCGARREGQGGRRAGERHASELARVAREGCGDGREQRIRRGGHGEPEELGHARVAHGEHSVDEARPRFAVGVALRRVERVLDAHGAGRVEPARDRLQGASVGLGVAD
jgi:hypothetical protein